MKFSPRETEILDFLSERKAPAKGIARALEIKTPNLSKYSKKLEAFHLLKSRRNGKSKELSLDDKTAFGISIIRNTFPELRLRDVLVGKTPYLLAHLRSRREFKIHDLDIPVATAKRTLSRLRKAGFVSMQKKGIYHLRTEAEMVSEFCRQTLMSAHYAEAERELGRITQAIYSFDSAKEIGALFVVKNEASSKKYWPTAYSVAHKYGLQTIPAGKWYYCNSKPDPEDVVIQILALGQDARSIMYAAVLILKNKRNLMLLLKKRQTYGLGREYILGFVRFLQSNGKEPFGGINSFDEIEVMLNENV